MRLVIAHFVQWNSKSDIARVFLQVVQEPLSEKDAGQVATRLHQDQRPDPSDPLPPQDEVERTSSAFPHEARVGVHHPTWAGGGREARLGGGRRVREVGGVDERIGRR